MRCVKQKNLISLVERVMHNRFCDRNLLKTGRTFFLRQSARVCPLTKTHSRSAQLNLNRANYSLRTLLFPLQVPIATTFLLLMIVVGSQM